MSIRGLLFGAAIGLLLMGVGYATAPFPTESDPTVVGQRTTRKLQTALPFRQYPGVEYYDFALPPDYATPGEWVFARLMYRSVSWGRRSRSNWTIDYPRSDRHLASAVRRLTRVDARSVEQPVAAEDGDDLRIWPWLDGVEVGHWDLTDLEAARLRDYLLRGGFFMCDDFHGTAEWQMFVSSMKKVFPDRQIVDLPDSDQIFDSVYDLDDRYQVPGEQFVYTHRCFEYDGFEARGGAMNDDKGRVVVAICHNMDLGDSWEHANNPLYPVQASA